MVLGFVPIWSRGHLTVFSSVRSALIGITAENYRRWLPEMRLALCRKVSSSYTIPSALLWDDPWSWHAELREALLGTGDTEIVEHTTTAAPGATAATGAARICPERS